MRQRHIKGGLSCSNTGAFLLWQQTTGSAGLAASLPPRWAPAGRYGRRHSRVHSHHLASLPLVVAFSSPRHRLCLVCFHGLSSLRLRLCLSSDSRDSDPPANRCVRLSRVAALRSVAIPIATTLAPAGSGGRPSTSVNSNSPRRKYRLHCKSWP